MIATLIINLTYSHPGYECLESILCNETLLLLIRFPPHKKSCGIWISNHNLTVYCWHIGVLWLQNLSQSINIWFTFCQKSVLYFNILKSILFWVIWKVFLLAVPFYSVSLSSSYMSADPLHQIAPHFIFHL